MLLVLSFAVLIFFVSKTGIELNPVQHRTLEVFLKIYLAVSIYCIIASELTRNYSQVDRLWSLIPLLYAWTAAYISEFSWRSVLVAILISLWGIRLSYNFALKGGYSWLPWKGEEDYRWAYLRKEGLLANRWIWSLFNIFFISLYQLGLILYFSIPVVLIIGSKNSTFNWIDSLALFGFVLFLLIETQADLQQYRFQSMKYNLIEKGEKLTEPYDKGFITTGLWKYMRHPNYMAEQMIWFMVYLFGVAASGQWLNWTIGGFVLLVLLFKGSSDFSEKISASKYPAYSDYQKSTGRFFPNLFK